ncbi:hypothetical protein CONCODRAFT_80503 [Conidiobolus coronatus NRRL 28638]|uniref:Secreted protein n=1 Tax=Conidiobolus coronatus (strain ATCC 28846 / CBS 209.66 / NRRL 28638) TaxID=796925 RepID=A0A137NUP2_CONC2|nr:hypothetical protein CONCODRAFT_80503 [Conidiobolus coronatus NRRL 28638]|eukprot:KXN66391.1 hypothetical protein CONCODRAFT_80503 [Conidiobolus coronatus NRRL 28638]
MLIKSIVTLAALLLNTEAANYGGTPLPNPLPDTCLLVGSDPQVACAGACPPCWVVNINGKVECYDYKPGTKQCLGWQGMEDVSQKLIDRAIKNGYYNATSLPSALSPTAKPSGTSNPGSDATRIQGASFLTVAAGLLLTLTLH